jgi:CHAD domain-containing protein
MAKAWKIQYLNPDKSLDICLPKVLNIRFNEMLSYEMATIEGKDIEYLHSMRISSRRVQAILKAFRDYYPPKKYIKEYSRLKSLIRALGVVRHYDVLIEMLEKYRDKIAGNKRDALEMIIIRQKSFRSRKRKELLNTMKLLNKKRFKESFQNFISYSG